MTLAISAPVLADDAAPCGVSVEPRAAAGGSAFTFSGHGFAPTRVEVRHGNEAPTASAITVAGADPWQVTIQSRSGDEGRWLATFSNASGCTATVRFRVTLPVTDAMNDTLGGQPANTVPVLLYVLVGAIGAAGGLLLRDRLASSHAWLKA